MPMFAVRRRADQREDACRRRRRARRPATQLAPASACPPRRTSPSARRRPRRPSRSAPRARLRGALARSAGIARLGQLAAAVGRRTSAPSSRTRSTTPREGLLLADRQLDRDRPSRPQTRAQRLERALEAGALAIEPVERRPGAAARARRPRPTPSRSAPRRRRRRRRRPARRRPRAAPRARR